jgi:hypothetical protein
MDLKFLQLNFLEYVDMPVYYILCYDYPNPHIKFLHTYLLLNHYFATLSKVRVRLCLPLNKKFNPNTLFEMALFLLNVLKVL